jgi:hypothetical protein
LPAVVAENLDMPEFDESKETVEQQALSDQEVWSAIRYLDLEIEHDPSSGNAIIALTTARKKLRGEKTSLRKCIGPLMEISSPGHDELRACLSL